MLEVVLKTFFASMIIAFFIMICLRSAENSVNEAMLYSRHAAVFNRLANNTVCSCGDSECLIASAPALIGGEPVRVCEKI